MHAHLVAVVELPELPDTSEPMPVDLKVLEVVAGSETRERVKVWGGIHREQPNWRDLRASSTWIVALLASNDRANPAYTFMSCDQSALEVRGEQVIGRIEAEDALHARRSSRTLLELKGAVLAARARKGCRTTGCS
jgi:hypothetical protein